MLSQLSIALLQRQLDIVAESLQEERCNSEVCIQFFLYTLEFPHAMVSLPYAFLNAQKATISTSLNLESTVEKIFQGLDAR